MEFFRRIIWKLWLGQVPVDFFNCPNMETFASWDFLSQALRIMIKNWSNDVGGFKMRCWPKIWTFDCQMTILPLQLTVVQPRVLTVQFWAECLETLHEGAWPCLWACETWLGLWNLQILDQNSNPSFDCIGAFWLCNPWRILQLGLAISWRIWEGKFWGTTVAPVQSS